MNFGRYWMRGVTRSIDCTETDGQGMGVISVFILYAKIRNSKTNVTRT